jgi:hypothetical protein
MNAGLELSCIDAARQLTQLFADAAPPFSLSPLTEYFGVSEVRERPLDRDARLVFESGRLLIEVNSLYPKVRRRLSIAHEIGHLIIDRCSPNEDSHWGHQDPGIETLCDRLAGQLLAPDWAIRKHFDEFSRLADWRQSIRCSTILAAASKFGLSVDAIACRVVHELRMAPSVFAIVWRHSENSIRPNSERDLRVGSSWHCRRSRIYIPKNKTAPVDSVIRKAAEKEGILCREERLSLGGLRGQFLVEAAGFSWSNSVECPRRPKGILSLLTSQSAALN